MPANHPQIHGTETTPPESWERSHGVGDLRIDFFDHMEDGWRRPERHLAALVLPGWTWLGDDHWTAMGPERIAARIWTLTCQTGDMASHWCCHTVTYASDPTPLSCFKRPVPPEMVPIEAAFAGLVSGLLDEDGTYMGQPLPPNILHIRQPKVLRNAS